MEPERFSGPGARSCRTVCALLAILLTWLGPLAHGVEMPSLYSVVVPLNPRDSDARNSAYRAALAEVLVRVTGSTGVAESGEIMSLFPNPARFVMQTRPAPDDSLDVSLNGAAIERVLRQAGAPVWAADRPLTLVWLAVDWGRGQRQIIGADEQDQPPGAARSIDRNRLLRGRVQEVATRRGVPVAFPLLDAEDLESVGFSDIWGGFDDKLLGASRRYEATSVLVGRIRPNTRQPQRWSWYLNGQRLDWGGEPEEAIDLLADSLAARYAISGDQPAEKIHLTISGIDSVRAYGQVQRHMESLRVIDKLMIDTVAADRITYEIEIQGGVERLDKALALSGMLIPVEPTGVIAADPRRLNQGPPGARVRPLNEPRSLEYFYRPTLSDR